tara:strand:+ start:15 stop:263 length:249 start_codon:yes stop_codon:yes gene_type:complete
MFKKQLLEKVLQHKLYKALIKTLPDDQKKMVESRLEQAATQYSENILEKFSELSKESNTQKAVKEIFNKEVINEKTGKPTDK